LDLFHACISQLDGIRCPQIEIGASISGLQNLICILVIFFLELRDHVCAYFVMIHANGRANTCDNIFRFASVMGLHPLHGGLHHAAHGSHPTCVSDADHMFLRVME
jgi:hypothetical protein